MAMVSISVLKSLEKLFEESTKNTEALEAYWIIRNAILSPPKIDVVTSKVPLLCQGLNGKGEYVYQAREYEEKNTG